MEYVKLGRTGLEESRICLGCMSYGRLRLFGVVQYNDNGAVEASGDSPLCCTDLQPGEVSPRIDIMRGERTQNALFGPLPRSQPRQHQSASRAPRW
jgi:hypothetical protein